MVPSMSKSCKYNQSQELLSVSEYSHQSGEDMKFPFAREGVRAVIAHFVFTLRKITEWELQVDELGGTRDG